MPISGLLITLDRDPEKKSDAIARLQSHPAIDLGDRDGLRLPIVVDTASSEDDRMVWAWLHELPGITFVDVVYIHFDDEGHAHDQSMTTPVSCAAGAPAPSKHSRDESCPA
jgi:nitrate reductase NapAB chaperone NapD